MRPFRKKENRKPNQYWEDDLVDKALATSMYPQNSKVRPGLVVHASSPRTMEIEAGVI